MHNARTLVWEWQNLAVEKSTKIKNKSDGTIILNKEDILVVKYVFEKFKEFKYLGSIISNNNDWSIEVMSRISMAEKTYFTATYTFFKSKLLSTL